MFELLLVWCVISVACFALVWRSEGLGTLFLSYFFGLSLIHVPGAFVYLGSTYDLSESYATYVGFKVTVVGLLSYLIGATLAFVSKHQVSPRVITHTHFISRVGIYFIAAGCISYFFVLPFISLVPSGPAIASSLVSLLVIGVWLLLFTSLYQRDHTRTILIILLLPALPLFTVLSGGFAGYGVYWMLSILLFFYVYHTQRFALLLCVPLLTWFGLSVGASYFQERISIRTVVWYEQADFSTRLNQVLKIADNFEWFSVHNSDQVLAIEQRLNQNSLVGIGVEQLQNGSANYLYGDSVPWWALIPRVLWPGKPDVGGGGSLVADVTGIDFMANTSVGAGQPLEFFANFGWTGIVFGFFILGFLLLRMDIKLATAFRLADVRSILYIALPGLCLIQPGGNLKEILVSVVSAIFVARGVWFLIRRLNEQAVGTGKHMHLG